MSSLFDDYERLRTSGLFDPEFYVARYPEVAALNLDPLLHYLEEGARDRRDPCARFDSVFYVEQCQSLGQQPDNPLLHFLSVGAAMGLRPHPEAAEPTLPFLMSLDLVAVEPHEGGGAPSLRAEGWALADARIQEILASIGGRSLGAATYGLPRPDVAEFHRRYDGAGQSGFVLSIDRLPDWATGKLELDVAARTADGAVHRHPPTAIEVVHAPVARRAIVPLAGAPPTMLLYLDGAGVDEHGVLTVAGWVVSLAQIASVRVLIDDEVMGSAMIGIVRDDVAAAHPDFPNARLSGYSFIADLSALAPGLKTIKVVADAAGGIVREIIAPVELRPVARRALEGDRQLFSHCDEIALSTSGHLALGGWAVPPTPAETIEILLDGERVGEAKHGIERPDVGNVHPTQAHARHAGFSFAAALGVTVEGEHLVTLRVRTRGGEIYERVVPVAAVERAAAPALVEPGVARDEESIKLYLDVPRVVNGVADTPVRNSLVLSGWALARAGVAAIEVAIDGSTVTTAHYGAARRDVAAAFADWENSLASGFNVAVPQKSLSAGRHAVAVTLRAADGAAAMLEFLVDIEEVEGDGPWALRRRMTQAEIDLDTRILDAMGWHPEFLALLAVEDEDAVARAQASLVSLRDQAYEKWRAVVVTWSEKARDTLRARLQDGLAEIADRVEIRAAETKLGPETARLDDGASLVLAIGAGDVVGVNALFEFAIAAGKDPGGNFLYADERRLSHVSAKLDAFFKPQWSPDLLLSMNYIGRVWCARPSLVKSLGRTMGALFAEGGYDLVLRATEKARGIRHIPLVLSQRPTAGTTDSTAVEERALSRALARRAIAGKVMPGASPGVHRVARDVATKGLVSIIIPTCAARGLVKTCLDTLREKTRYRNFEIICIENIPKADRKWRKWLKANADCLVSTTEPFNWSRFNNLAAEKAKGEFLLFLNDDIEIIDASWLDVLLEHAERPEVGVVGPLLLYPDRRVQHAGMFLVDGGRARHAFRFAKEDDPGYFGLGLAQRNVIAVTGACLLTRRSTFDALGRFDEAHVVVNNDLDYCLRAWRSGLVNVFTPHTTLIHHELASRAKIDDTYDAGAFIGEWSSVFLHGDPYHHPSLTQDDDDFVAQSEPARYLCASRPLLDPAKVERVLVMKLDHIGDGIIALPAIRRLRQVFPNARLTVLAAKVTRMVWALEPAIDEVIEFEFFHARSGLGRVEVSEDDLAALRARLEPMRFDIAIDLRKTPDTRHVLQSTGARFLAGYDYQNRFPWLDIALEWEGDPTYVTKRQQTGSDLLSLVGAVEVACGDDPSVIRGVPVPTPALDAPKVKRHFRRPVVCIHPAAGTVMKLWPSEYYAALIDLLVEDADVNIVIIGGPDEQEVADAVMAHVRHHERVMPFIGTLKLAELPSLIARSALFVGNDSGPKHIAAGLGVPTVGIHSGVVDAREWGPMGPLAVAIRRDTTCSPCYFEKHADCHRDLACLKGLYPADVLRVCLKLLGRGEAVTAKKAGTKRASVVPH